MPVTKLVVVSDLHVGSTLGVLHPGFKTLEGNSVGQNPIQKWLWKAWKHLWEVEVPSFVGKDKFAVVINGDLVEGIHHGTKQVISPDFGDHVRAVQQVLVPVTKLAPAHIFITEGTESHTRNSETTIGEIIGAEQDPATERYAFPRLDLNIAGAHCVFFHHIGTTTRPYLEGSSLSTMLGVERQEAARSGTKIPLVIGCAHRHRHGYFSDGQGMIMVTGAFQALTRFGHKVVPAAVPAPSAFMLDWTGLPPGSLPVVREKVYSSGQTNRPVFSI